MNRRGRACSAAYLTALALAACAGLVRPASAQTASVSQETLAAAGAAVFQEDGCANCHFKDSTYAPPLEGVAGRNIASAPGFLYSADLKAKPGNWTDANLDAFLADPHVFAPGTSMDASVEDPARRRDVIAYLKTLKSPSR